MRNPITISLIGLAVIILGLAYMNIFRPIAILEARNAQLAEDLHTARWEQIELRLSKVGIAEERDACMKMLTVEEREKVRGF